jgi:hypothetical protein
LGSRSRGKQEEEKRHRIAEGAQKKIAGRRERERQRPCRDKTRRGGATTETMMPQQQQPPPP